MNTLAKEKNGSDNRKEKDGNESFVRRPNSYAKASLISKLLFLWPYDMLSLGRTKTLTENDLEDILPEESSHLNLQMIEKFWEEAKRQHKQKKKSGEPTLHKVLLVDFIKTLWRVQILNAIGLVARMGQALSLGLLIQYFSDQDKKDSNVSSREGYTWALVLVLCGTVTLMEHHHVFFRTWRKGLQLKTASISAIYAKSLRLSSLGGSNIPSAGNIVNLATNDVERFLTATLFVSYLFWGPVYAIVALVIGIIIVGPAFAAGFSLLLVFMPMQFYLSNRFAYLRSTVAKITDSRVNLVSQAVAGARVMKMSGWELQFKNRIEKVRKKETNRIQQASRLRGLNEAVYFFSSIVMYLVVFIVEVKTGGTLTPRKAFTTMTLINIIQFETMKHFSLGVMFVSECFVSINRLSTFLNTPEIASGDTPSRTQNEQKFVDDTLKSKLANETALCFSNVSCYWDSSSYKSQTNSNSKKNEEDVIDMTQQQLAISDINFELNYGKLYCIVGSVGSGKSALMLAMAGELPCSKGVISHDTLSISYAAQEPFIMDGTVRENILMGLEFCREWYEKVIASCGLTEDFKQFRSGDSTIVGDRGVQCSGGQRARIGLARAIYRDPEIILLDDPLSAVDANVGKLIFFSAIQDLCVKRGKCVVLATHQHQFIGNSQCILMSKGRAKCKGTFADCLEASEGTLVNSSRHSSTNDLTSLGKEAENGMIEKNQTDKVSNKIEKHVVTKWDKNNEEDVSSHMEQKISGVVKSSTFFDYMRAMGGVLVVLGLLVLFATTQVSVLYTVVVVGEWSEKSVDDQRSLDTIGFVLGIMGTVVFLAIARSIFGFFFAIKASHKLHDNMVGVVLRAKIDFFDCNPLGRILNRFSADVGIIDDLLPTTLFDFTMCAFMVLGGIATTAYVLPFVLLVFPPIVYYFITVRRTFLSTSRELKRIEGVARSPLYAMLSESLNGIATIRTNNALQYFQKKFEEKQNNHTRAFWSFIAASRWLGFRMEFIMWILLTTSSFTGVIVIDQGWLSINPSILGLALMMIIQLGSLFQWTVRQSAEVVNQMVSVERILQFSSLPPEAPLEMNEDKKHPNWPLNGKIDIDSVCLRYRSNLPLSLENASFQINGGERIGIVGRTGAGKSTFTQGLLRLLESETGKICIDNVDIVKLGLHKLRTQMSVIAQTPILFNGCTIRENLDPFNKYDDKTIRKALVDVQMINAVDDLPGKLDSIVAESGSNFSVGQRQLLCLARAILRKNKILVLDEPTANVDGRTDELLQQAVANSFPEATVIAIAHRLDTVIEYDKILVLGGGKILEFDSAFNLLQNDNGYFKSMVNDTGEAMSMELHRRASLAFYRKSVGE